MRLIKKENTGFSLLETIIAIMVLTIAMSAVFALVSRGVRSVSASANEMTASFLASEGIEYVRNIRDGIVLSKKKSGDDDHGTLASSYFTSCYNNPANGTFGCAVDPYGGYSGGASIIGCASGVCLESVLNFNSGLNVYNHTPVVAGTNELTIFKRKIIMQDVIPDKEVVVRSIVSWRQFPADVSDRTLELETHIFNTKF